MSVVRMLRSKAAAATRRANLELVPPLSKYRGNRYRALRVRAQAFKDAAQLVKDHY